MSVGSLVDVLRAVRDEFLAMLKTMGEMLLSKIKIMSLIDEVIHQMGIEIDNRPDTLPISNEIPEQLREFASGMFQMMKDPTVLHKLGENEIKNPISNICAMVEAVKEDRRKQDLAVDDQSLLNIIDVRRRFRVILFRYFRFILCAACQNRDAWQHHFDAIQFPCHLIPMKMTSSGIPFSSSLSAAYAGQYRIKSDGNFSSSSLSPGNNTSFLPNLFPAQSSSLGGEREARKEEATFVIHGVQVEEKTDGRSSRGSGDGKGLMKRVRKTCSYRSSDDASNRDTSSTPSGFSAALRSSLLPPLKTASSLAAPIPGSKVPERSHKSDSVAGQGFFLSLIMNSTTSWGVNPDMSLGKSTSLRQPPRSHHQIRNPPPHPHHRHHHRHSSVDASDPSPPNLSNGQRHSHSARPNTASTSISSQFYFHSKGEGRGDIQRLGQAVMECKSRIEAVTQSVRRSVERLIDVEELLESISEAAETTGNNTTSLFSFPLPCSQSGGETNTGSRNSFSQPLSPLNPSQSPSSRAFSENSPVDSGSAKFFLIEKPYRQCLMALGTALDCFMGTCVVQEEEEREKNSSYFDVARPPYEGSHRIGNKGDIGFRSLTHVLFPSARVPPLFAQEKDKEDEAMPRFARISLLSSFTALLSAQCPGNSDLGFGESICTGALQSPPLSYCSVVEFSHSGSSSSRSDSGEMLGDGGPPRVCFLEGERPIVSTAGEVSGKAQEDGPAGGLSDVPLLPYSSDDSLCNPPLGAPPQNGGEHSGGSLNDLGGASKGGYHAKMPVAFENDKHSFSNSVTVHSNIACLSPSYHYSAAETITKVHEHHAARIRQDPRFLQPQSSPSLSTSTTVSFAPFMTPLPSSKTDGPHPGGSSARLNKTGNGGGGSPASAAAFCSLQNHVHMPHPNAMGEEGHLAIVTLLFKIEMVANNLSGEFAACFLQIVPEILETCPLIVRADGAEYKKIKLKKDKKTVSLPKIQERLQVL